MHAADVLSTLVSDMLAAGDAPARVFLARHMGCVGCPFAAFETVAEAAASYGTDPRELADSLLEAVATSAKGSSS